MPSAAALTVYCFGATSLLAGLHNLLLPSRALATLDLPSACASASNGLALAAIAMGVYYPLAAFQENSAFFLMTIPMRSLTAAVFWSYGTAAWRLPAAWEGLGALATAVALIWGRRRQTR